MRARVASGCPSGGERTASRGAPRRAIPGPVGPRPWAQDLGREHANDGDSQSGIQRRSGV